MPRIKLLKSGDISEDSIQKSVVHWARLQPGLRDLLLHVPNEGKRTPQYGWRLKSIGLLPGVWDLFIACGRQGYIGAWIELKSANGRLTPEQVVFGNNMEQQGYFTAVCYSIESAINTIQWYYY
jgi:hypothetical protein